MFQKDTHKDKRKRAKKRKKHTDESKNFETDFGWWLQWRRLMDEEKTQTQKKRWKQSQTFRDGEEDNMLRVFC